MHPVDEKQRAFFDTEASIKKNREYFDSYVELAIKHGGRNRFLRTWWKDLEKEDLHARHKS
jgi:hypothetical protein